MESITEEKKIIPQFVIQSSDSVQLERARRIADTFAQQYTHDPIVGVVFLGAIARGYFDHDADIDIVLFTAQGAKVSLPGNYIEEQGCVIHCGLAEYTAETATSWDMAKRWAFSQGEIVYDPSGKIARLLQEKVPLKPEEKRWLLIEGMTQSEWYVNTLSRVWIRRGSLMSAQQMFGYGLAHFFDVVFALNNALVADTKWRYFCAAQLPQLPSMFGERIQEVLRLTDFSCDDIDRRRHAFMAMWHELLPLVEQEVQLPFETFQKLV